MANQPELTLAIDACPALANPAVARCFQAWKQAWEATRPGKESDYFAEKAGAKAYRSALPALSGVANLTACASPAMPAGPYLAYAQGATGSACPGGLTGVTTAGITFDSPTGYQNSSGGSFLLVQLISSDDLQWTSSGGPGGKLNPWPGQHLPVWGASDQRQPFSLSAVYVYHRKPELHCESVPNVAIQHSEIDPSSAWIPDLGILWHGHLRLILRRCGQLESNEHRGNNPRPSRGRLCAKFPISDNRLRKQPTRGRLSHMGRNLKLTRVQGLA